MRLTAILLIFIIGVMLNSIDSDAQQSGCDYGIGILADGDEFDSKDFNWRMQALKVEGASTKITGTAKIEDSNGRTVKSYKPWTSETISRQKTSSKYTPNLKPGTYKIIAEIIVECDDKNDGNNKDTKTIRIKNGNKEEKDNKDEEDLINSIKEDKKNEVKQIKDIAPKQETIKADEERTISLRTNSKLKNEQAKSSIAKSPETVYESSSEKSKGLIMLSLLALSILVNVILIWKR